MTTFARTWNAAYEAVPADTDNASEGALRIRNLKEDIRERLDVAVSIAGDGNDGQLAAPPLSSGTNTVTATLGLASYVTGSVYAVRIATTNTGAVTLNLDSLGALAVQTIGGRALAAGELVAGMIARFLYNGTNFRLLNPEARTFTNHHAGGRTWMYNGATVPAEVSTTAADNAWASVGPTGSGADVIMSDMNSVPTDATAVIIGFTASIGPITGAFFVLEVRVRPGNRTWAGAITDDLGNVVGYIATDNSGTAWDILACGGQAAFPLDPADRTFDIRINANVSGIKSLTMGYKGFIAS